MNTKQVIKLALCLLLTLAAAQLATAQKPELVVQTGHSGWIHTVAFSPDGKIFACGGSDQTVRLWSAATGAELRTLRGHTYSVLALAFNRQGLVLASGGGDSLVKLWDPKDRQSLADAGRPQRSSNLSGRPRPGTGLPGHTRRTRSRSRRLQLTLLSFTIPVCSLTS